VGGAFGDESFLISIIPQTTIRLLSFLIIHINHRREILLLQNTEVIPQRAEIISLADNTHLRQFIGLPATAELEFAGVFRLAKTNILLFLIFDKFFALRVLLQKYLNRILEILLCPLFNLFFHVHPWSHYEKSVVSFNLHLD